MNQVVEAIEAAQSTKGKPTCIIAHTVKGKGVSYMECSADWHGRAPNKEELDKAICELREKGGVAR